MSGQRRSQSYGFGGDQETNIQERDTVHMVQYTVKELLPQLTQAWRTSKERVEARFAIIRGDVDRLDRDGPRLFGPIIAHGTVDPPEA